MTIRLRAKSTARILLWAQRTLFACAFLALGYCGFVLAESWLFQRQANTQLNRLLQQSGKSAKFATPAAEVDEGGLIGRIEVDRLGISVAVVEGTDTSTLEHAAGHIPGTAMPGETGNVGIAAHRDTFFRPLRNVHANDVIRVTTPTGEYHYRVVSTKVVSPEDVSVLKSDGHDILTLVTCYPFYFVGSAPSRFIVRAEAADETGISPQARALQPPGARPHL